MAIPEAGTVHPTFERFFEEQRDQLVRLAHLLTGSQEIAEDLAQEAMLAVHRRWEQLDNPAGYARTSLVNLARSYHRHRAVEGRHTASPPIAGLPPEVDEMWELIRRLRVDDRVLLVLRFYEDLTIDEIARTLDRPAGTIKSSLHRTLARLREELG